MKWQQAEHVMKKVEELYPERAVHVVSAPDSEIPSAEDRHYTVEVDAGTLGGDEMATLTGIASEVEAEVALAGRADGTTGINVAIS